MSLSNEKTAPLIEYLDHVLAAQLSDFSFIKHEVNELVKQPTITKLQTADLLWDLGSVQVKMQQLHSELKTMQDTLRGIHIGS